MRSIIRSNQNAIMYRHTNGTYSIFENRSQTFTLRGTLNACKKAWNLYYRNTRQFMVSGRHCDL